MRVLIRSLRDSPLGTGGLAETLRLPCPIHGAGIRGSDCLELRTCWRHSRFGLLPIRLRGSTAECLRHSKASEVTVGVVDGDGDLRITVEEDGIGFGPESVDQKTHFGLALMRERIEIAGGVLYVDSRLGEGTRIIAKLPSNNEQSKGGPPKETRP